MARTIKEIHGQMAAELTARLPELSHSAVAEWRLLLWVVAAAISAFETILDIFRSEIDAVADKITPGTVRWYVEQCRMFQNGHELLFDNKTAQLYYATDDPASRIVSVVAVTERPKFLSIKVARLNAQNEIKPLDVDELYNFAGYLDSIKFAGIETVAVSTSADKLRYAVDVYFDPAIPVTVVREGVLASLSAFRTALDFNSMLYKQRFVDAIMNVKGVVTVDLRGLDRKGTSMQDYAPVSVADELESGYFDYDAANCTLTLKSTRTAV